MLIKLCEFNEWIYLFQTVKRHYRRLLLGRVLTSIDEGRTAADIKSSITVLDACKWVSRAVHLVSPETVTRCFTRAGLQVADAMPVSDDEDDIPLADLLFRLREHLPEPMTEEEYMTSDSNIPAVETLGENWEQELLAEIRSDTSMPEPEDAEDVEVVGATPPPSITTSLQYVREIEQCCLTNNLGNILEAVSTLQQRLEEALLQKQVAKKQTTIDSFFKH